MACEKAFKPCHGNTEEHCCVFGSKACRFIEENTVPGRRWACQLVREHNGDWDAAIADPRYQRYIVPLLEHFELDYNCKTYSTEGCYCGDR